MAENEQGQEKTEDPTGKRLGDARQKGQVPRSREMNTFFMMLCSAITLMLLGAQIVDDITRLWRDLFTINRNEIFDVQFMIRSIQYGVVEGLSSVSMFAIILVAVAIFSSISIGGWNFSLKAMEPKASKMGPLKGLQRIVGPKGFVELLKAIAKVSLIGITAVVMLNFIAEDVVNLGRQALEPALANMAWYVIIFFAVLSLSLILVAMIDVPFQQWDHKRQLRMSKDEIKQENKQQEGSPETKQRVRSTQREMAMRRMMEEVPKADVVITNPTHFAVALKYDTEKNGAPIVVAKGADIVAGKIRQLALDHNIPILSSPVLARAIFFSTELNDEIPSALYMAVAKILAYIYQLKARPGTKFTKPINMPDVDVPDDYRYDNE